MILACGEALVDLIPASFGVEPGYLLRGGGSSYNVAIALGRLGVPVGFVGRVSLDPFGRMLRDRLAANGVDLTHLRTGDEPTALGVVQLAAGGEPQFAFYAEGTADRLMRVEDLPEIIPGAVTALHFGSISMVREPGASAFEQFMRRAHDRGRVVSLDPNVRPSVIGERSAYLQRLGGWLSAADVVKLSRDDLDWLYPGEPPKAIARRWLALGPALVVVTRGDAGATAFSGEMVVTAPAVRGMVADTVGAGDAFTAGLLAQLHELGLLYRKELTGLTRDAILECLGQANRVAGLACRRPGSEPPTRVELDA